MSDNTLNMAIVYGAIALFSLLLVGSYNMIVKERDKWLALLFVSVFVVNTGYFALSISHTLEAALMANRIAYLGSVFLPLCMLMSIIAVCRANIKRWMIGALAGISFMVFLIAASQGYLPLYYKEVALVYVNGMAKLSKVYGPLHSVYLIYLIAYFGMMLGTILKAFASKRSVPYKHAYLLLIVVLLNIMIWGVEQVVYTDFEFLSVSYIISELLLLLLNSVIQDYRKMSEVTSAVSVADPATPIAVANKKEIVGEPEEESQEKPEEEAEEEPAVNSDSAADRSARIEQIMAGWQGVSQLTMRERDVLRCLLENRKRKDIADYLFITEHTVKKHTSNIFSKLEVSNRKELFEKADSETPRG